MSNDLNKYATHPLQTYQWADFREKTGIKVIRDSFVITIHKIPKTPFNIGYFPKGQKPTKEMIDKLKEIGRRERCIFIQLEPNVISSPQLTSKLTSRFPSLIPSFHPLFTKYTFILDLTKSEEELLKYMHPKTRYNIKVAQKHGVKVVEDNSDQAFEQYLKLTKETTNRQGFFAHTEKYHRLMWSTLKPKTKNHEPLTNNFTAHLLTAKFRPPNSDVRPLTLIAWIVFVFKDTLYYPYGASSSEHREVMASNLMMWEVVKFGKKLGLKKFDMWGALGPNPNPKDPWYGFHKFKQGYAGKLIEFVGSYDLVINPFLYKIYKIADKIRWLILRFRN